MVDDTIYAASWSGGKDSTLALDRALSRGLDVRYLFNIYEGSSGRVRFHGTRRGLIAAQAAALGLELIQHATGPDDFEAVFVRTLQDLVVRGAGGVVFGDIHLEDIRAWYEERTARHGCVHVEPLWREEPVTLLEEFRARGYRALVVSVDLEQGSRDWLGRELDDDLIQELQAAPGVDPCGEHGEYHSFVFDGPRFSRPVDFRAGRSVEMEGHALLDLLPPDGAP